MKVVFLDIDGVLWTGNSAEYQFEKLGKPASGKSVVFDDTAVSNLQKLIEQTGAKIVVSSTWRFNQTVNSMQNTLAERGLKCEVVGLTPDGEKINGLYRAVPRGNEIKQWLDPHTEVEKYLIIDDDSDMLPEQLDNFVQCDFEDGFANQQCFEKALQILS